MAVGLLSCRARWACIPETATGCRPGSVASARTSSTTTARRGSEYRSLKGEDDVLTVQLPRAVALLAEPKLSGRRRPPRRFACSGIIRSTATDRLYEGQYGPYVKHGDVSASLPRGGDPAAFTAPAAMELLAAKRASSPRRGRGAGRSRKKQAAAIVKKASVVGGGLAGSEAAWQLAERGVT